MLSILRVIGRGTVFPRKFFTLEKNRGGLGFLASSLCLSVAFHWAWVSFYTSVMMFLLRVLICRCSGCSGVSVASAS